MSKVILGRHTARYDGPFVLFAIGMKVHRPLRVWEWAPAFGAMPKMIGELSKNPESGFLGAQLFFSLTQPMLLQYWRDFDSLTAYAQNKLAAHFPAWTDFNRKTRRSGSIGIWHETYRIDPGAYENIYVNMPLWGLGKARGAQHIKAEGRLANAAERMRA
jgi:hypothetical protein